MSVITSINTVDAPKPVGPYSQATMVDGWLYCSGQIAINPENGEMVTKDVKVETHQVLTNLFAVLEAAGAKCSDVVKTTIYLTDLKNFNDVNDIYSEFFNSDTNPARACIEVSALPKGGTVEIECVAFVKK